MTPWGYAELAVRELWLEAKWRQSIARHTAEGIEPRLLAWRRLAAVRAVLAKWGEEKYRAYAGKPGTDAGRPAGPDA